MIELKDMAELMKETAKKLVDLEKWFKSQKGSIVAFSGGIDSSLVLYLARLFQGKKHAIGVISNSESLKTKDFELAQSFSKQFDIIMEVIVTRELQDERYNENPIDRCFFCKDHLFGDLQTICDQYQGFHVLSGTNADDYSDYRPGLKAATKYEVLSPLAACKITKEEIRQIARYYDLPNWDKPASPCLSSRIPYNHKITRKKLLEIEQAEDLLNSFGFNDVRVRHYGDIGKVEVKKEDIPRLLELKESVVGEIRKIGFKEVVIDEEGLVSGKLNRAISNESKVKR
ncbi:MAG: ATP-dependent sacrificial sulfur transferase LarE [Bacteroidales bacterium]|nr:ATP-dependent sacrificial sulfur transferase LarE [Bacteroidales bacterium]